MQQAYWRIVEGGLPGCPIGTVISFVNEGDTARVIREGVGQIGTLYKTTTEQTGSADGTTITLVNATEGWRAVLTRTAPSTWLTPQAAGSGKDRVVAAALAILLGNFGIHKFYLGKVMAGVIYLVFFWTYIPGIIGWIEGITYLAKSNEAWAQEYGGPVQTPSSLAIGCLWILVALPLFAVLLIVALIFLGGQVSKILSAVGNSV